jgi:Nucleoside-diphosphate-sugar epimerases
MKILITGVTGFIGNNLLKRMLARHTDVGAIIRNEYRRYELERQGVHCLLDEGSHEELVKFIRKERFDGIVHLASCFVRDHKPGEINDLINSNIMFPARIIEAGTECCIPWFINTGTFWQHFDNRDYLPVNLYAATKQAFEDIARFYYQQRGVDFVTIKLNDTYGPGDTRPKIFNLWKKVMGSGEKLGMSPGGQLIDIVFIDDVIDAYVQLMELLEKDSDRKLCGKTFAVSSGKAISLRELAVHFESVSGRKLPIAWGEKPYRSSEVMVPWNKGECVPGWKAKVSLEKGIKILLEEKEG